MKKIILFFIKLTIKILQIIQFAINKIVYYFVVFKIYLTGEECEKFKDCLLLAKLRSRQPPSDRYIEYPWLLENLNLTQGKLLDIGSTIGDLLYETLPREVEINCLNLNSKEFKNKQIKFKQGDIRKTDYPDNYFDLISCVSTLEHIGVRGRYHSDNDSAGDIKAMREMKRILRPGGNLLITTPYGAKDILPINKLYNKTRIADLFSGLEIVSQEFIKFNKNWHVWLKTTETDAAQTDMLKDGWYALCLIKARKV